MKDYIVKVNNIKMKVVESGDNKETILFLHGFPESHHSWRKQLNFLSNKFRCISPDLRGFGETDKPSHGYEIENLSTDIYSLVETLNLKDVILCGHDWGGVIAWDFVYRYPHKVKALIIMNAPHPLDYIREVFTNPLQFFKSWYVFVFQLPFLPERLFSFGGNFLVGKIIDVSTVRKDTFTADERKIMKSNISKNVLRCGINYYRKALTGFVRWRKKYSKKVEVPLLVIWGERDFFLHRNLAKNQKRFTEGYFRLKFIEDCGHWVQQEAPDEVNEEIESFLKEILS